MNGTGPRVSVLQQYRMPEMLARFQESCITEFTSVFNALRTTTERTMATRKQTKPDWLKAKVRTARMAMDIDGPLDSALPDVFLMIGTAERRNKVIEKIKEIHAGMCESEAEPSSA